MLCQIPTSVEMEPGMRIGSDLPIFRLDLCPESIGVDGDYRCYCHFPLLKRRRQMPPCRGAKKCYDFAWSCATASRPATVTKSATCRVGWPQGGLTSSPGETRPRAGMTARRKRHARPPP